MRNPAKVGQISSRNVTLGRAHSYVHKQLDYDSIYTNFGLQTGENKEARFEATIF